MTETPIKVTPSEALSQAEEQIRNATPEANILVDGALNEAYPYNQGANRVPPLQAAMNVIADHQSAKSKPIEKTK